MFTITILADSEKNPKKMLLNTVDKTIKQEHKIKINIAKTKILVCSGQYIAINIIMNNITLERVNSSKHLGSKGTSDGKSTTYINWRIAQAKQAFSRK